MNPEEIREALTRMDDEVSVREHNPPEGFDPQLSRLFVADLRLLVEAARAYADLLETGRVVVVKYPWSLSESPFNDENDFDAGRYLVVPVGDDA